MSKSTMQKAIDLIMTLDSTYEVSQVIDAIKLKQNYLASEARRNFVAGDSVQFTSRNGQLYTGTVDKIKQKTAYEIMPSLVGSEMCIRDS